MSTTKHIYSKTRIVPIMDLDDTVSVIEKTVALYDEKATKKMKKNKKKEQGRRVYPVVITEEMLPEPQWDD